MKAPSRFLVHSYDRTSSSASSTNFVVQLDSSYANYTRAKLKWVSIPLSVYQITNSNNTIYFNENSTNKTATIANGCYSASDLATAISTALNSASGGYNTYTITYSVNTFLLTFAAPNVFVLRWSQNSALARICGFSATDTSSATSQVSTFAIQLESYLDLNIYVQELGGLLHTSSGIAIPSTWTIPCKTGPAYLNIYIPEEAEIICTANQPFGKLTITLVDSNNNNITLNNSDWSFEFVLYYDEDYKRRRLESY